MNLNNNEQEVREVQLEEYALKLDAIDFACRSKAKAKPQGKEPACSSLRTVPIGKRTWTDGEPGKYSFSDCEVSKKVMYLLRHSQHVYREEDGADQFWRIKENLQKYFLYYSHLASGKHARQEEEETRKDFSTVLNLLEQLCISELFKDIQDAILLIFRYSTMRLFRATSSNAYIMSDVQSFCILSSVLD